MSEPVIAREKPYLVTVEEGKNYFWCACGRSGNQPWCDGSHKDTGMEPVMFKADKSGDVLLCGCKHTAARPYCDGTHNNLSEDGYAEADEEEIARTANNTEVPRDEVGKSRLDGGCYVLSVTGADLQEHGTLAIQPVISQRDGAKFLGQYYAEAQPGTTPVMAFGDSDVALFALNAACTVTIGGRPFEAGPETGIYVRPGEAFSITNEGDDLVKIILAVCPEAAPAYLDDMPETFDESVCDRSRPVDESKREPVADRFYQVLIDEEQGGAEVTQFIGEVPKSRAAFHHHLYEEALTILNGEGWMWTENKKTRVKPGDIIFLPRKQVHSLECTDPDGLRLMGVFYPSMSPAINY